MSKKVLLIIFTTLIIIIGAGSYFIFWNNEAEVHLAEEKQLYTCGMHPHVISEEPGDCPICGMKLVPKKGSGSNGKSTGEKKILYYRAPMNPSEIYDSPGKSQMGMDLVPVYEDESGAEGVVTVDGAVQQSMNVKITEVESKDLSMKIVTNGIVTTDERNEYIVTTKVNGWIEKLYVNYTGQKVKKGQKLVDIYSPELVAAQQELISALQYKEATGKSNNINVMDSGNELINNTIKKLELLDISEVDIKRLIETKEVKKYMTLYAPINGTVLMKYIIEGEKIMAGKNLLHIADLSNLWLKADIYESELNKVELGSSAEIRFSYMPGKVYTGKVTFIYPTVDPKTRVIQLRIDVPNTNDALKPSMFANVEIVGKNLGVYPSILETSVLRSGKKSIVILSLGEGKFKPVEVELGAYSDGYYQILKGVKTGNKIVSSAQFMIDSESSLRAAVQLFTNSDKKMDSMKENGQDGKKDESIDDEMDIKEHKHDGMESDIIREGVINLKGIDINKDGKVFQDFMDWNVISDNPGKCPICGMKLQEVSFAEAKENLINNGFKVK